jgi:hypothetical protein
MIPSCNVYIYIYIYTSKRKETYQFEEPGPEACHGNEVFHPGRNRLHKIYLQFCYTFTIIFPKIWISVHFGIYVLQWGIWITAYYRLIDWSWSRNMSCATNLRNLVQKHVICYHFEEPGPEICHVLLIWGTWSRNMPCAIN